MGERLTGDYRKHLDKPFLGHWDIAEGEDLIVTIDHMETCEVKSQRGTDHKTTAFFRERGVKPMILNVTNQKAITRALGSARFEDWEGRLIAIYAGREPKAEDGLALRVRDYAPKNPNPVCEDCGEVITDTVLNGKTYRAKAIAERSRSRYGRVLCMDCAKAEKEREAAANDAYEEDLNRQVRNEIEGVQE